MATHDLRTEALSACAKGEGKLITGTAWNVVTVIHDITQSDVIDAVYLELWNTSDVEVEVFLILNPNDRATQADVDASTISLRVPPHASLWALEGHKFRIHGTGTLTYTIAAYVDSADASKVMFLGHFTRLTQAEETA